MNFTSIAIDGPAGAGKSTLARKLAEQLGYIYVDTGAIYRTVALAVLRAGADPADPAQVVPLLEGMNIQMGYGGDGVQRMGLGPEDVTEAIRRPEISDAASKISAIPEVRTFLMEMQRDMARRHHVVMDGRDIGTVVLPEADLKIFLTASTQERARRRCAELQQRGTPVDYETVLADIIERDDRDSNRAAAPLRQAEDAIPVDTSGKSLEESLCILLQVVEERFS